jgi:osmotically-inducible protein OsmY
MRVAVSAADLEAAAWRALWEFDAVRLAHRPPNVSAGSDGVVVVSGPVRSRTIPNQVREILSAVPGVRAVEDHLLPDPDLEVRIAEALRRDPRTAQLPPGAIVTRVTYGTATLLGKLRSGKDRDAVLAVAGAVADVLQVDDRLT